MHRILSGITIVTLCSLLIACGGGKSAFLVPVDTKLRPWVAPETDELVSSETMSGEEEFEEYEDYEDEEDAVSPQDSTPASASTPKPKKS